jgi:Pectinacetylesterase
MRALLGIFVVACGGHGSPTPGDGITAPSEQWTWVPIDGMVCADGSATGIGVNLTDRSDRVAIFLQGGGACWDANTCFTLKAAVHIEGGYGESDFQSELATFSQSIYAQRVAGNPFADASIIYVPYCTGDLHDGDHVATYDVSGTPRAVHHVGGANADLYLAALQATRPDADVVWMFGISAGAYGVGFNWAHAHATWPQAHVHVLADSSPLVTMEPTRYAAMQTQWAMRFPAGCSGCATDLGAVPEALRAASGGDRYGLLSNLDDATISTYFGLGAGQLHTELVTERSEMIAGTGQAAFFVNGTSHVLLGNPAIQTSDGVVLSTWVTQWATGDASWASAGP